MTGLDEDRAAADAYVAQPVNWGFDDPHMRLVEVDAFLAGIEYERGRNGRP